MTTLPHWADDIHAVFKAHRIALVSYVPDAGHTRLIHLCRADDGIRLVPLTTEEEGIALAAGAYLGGQRAALLMQSSGVGNSVSWLHFRSPVSSRIASLPGRLKVASIINRRSLLDRRFGLSAVTLISATKSSSSRLRSRSG